MRHCKKVEWVRASKWPSRLQEQTCTGLLVRDVQGRHGNGRLVLVEAQARAMEVHAKKQL